jgi:hypothetical protein
MTPVAENTIGITVIFIIIISSSSSSSGSGSSWKIDAHLKELVFML